MTTPVRHGSWKHPTRGEVSPAEFIPLAEDTRVILHLGEWVLREAASWAEPLIVAVNVSAVQIHDLNFSAIVHDILCATGLAPSRLELEITETALVRDLDRALETLRKIKMLGVRVAMDDFGTGFSSLSNLRAFPFDKIKIDRSFVKSVHVNDQGAAIVRSVVGLSRALRLPVVAEGVETPAELAFLAGEAHGLRHKAHERDSRSSLQQAGFGPRISPANIKRSAPETTVHSSHKLRPFHSSNLSRPVISMKVAGL